MVIQTLATRAAINSELKSLLKIVASGKASPVQLKEFQDHINGVGSKPLQFPELPLDRQIPDDKSAQSHINIAYIAISRAILARMIAEIMNSGSDRHDKGEKDEGDTTHVSRPSNGTPSHPVQAHTKPNAEPNTSSTSAHNPRTVLGDSISFSEQLIKGVQDRLSHNIQCLINGACQELCYIPASTSWTNAKLIEIIDEALEDARSGEQRLGPAKEEEGSTTASLSRNALEKLVSAAKEDEEWRRRKSLRSKLLSQQAQKPAAKAPQTTNSDIQYGLPLPPSGTSRRVSQVHPLPQFRRDLSVITPPQHRWTRNAEGTLIPPQYTPGPPTEEWIARVKGEKGVQDPCHPYTPTMLQQKSTLGQAIVAGWENGRTATLRSAPNPNTLPSAAVRGEASMSPLVLSSAQGQPRISTQPPAVTSTTTFKQGPAQHYSFDPHSKASQSVGHINPRPFDAHGVSTDRSTGLAYPSQGMQINPKPRAGSNHAEISRSQAQSIVQGARLDSLTKPSSNLAGPLDGLQDLPNTKPEPKTKVHLPHVPHAHDDPWSSRHDEARMKGYGVP